LIDEEKNMRQANRILPGSFCFIMIGLFFLFYPLEVPAKDVIRINGSGAPLEMIKPLAASYGKNNPDVTFAIDKPLGSSGAIKALLAGAIDIAIVSRSLKPEEMDQGGKVRDYGKTPLAIVTGENVPIKTISYLELENIYSGKTKKWSNGEIIRIILRPDADIDTKILKGLSPGMADAVTQAQQRRGILVAVTDPESNEAVSKTIGSIGFSGLCGILADKSPLNLIALNGVRPSPENLKNKTYPLSKDISFVTTDKLTDAAAKFLEFVYSNKGRSIAEKCGVLITADKK
jgi:phosphate transport system substrate-binding protein